MNYSRSIVLKSTDGSAIATTARPTPTKVCTISVRPNKYDIIVTLRDGGGAGDIRWTIEADNAAGSSTVTFNPPLYFDKTLYVNAEATQSGGGAFEVCLAVIEPLPGR